MRRKNHLYSIKQGLIVEIIEQMLKLVFFSKSTSRPGFGGGGGGGGGGERNSYFGDKIKARDVHFGRNEHQQKNVQGLLGCSFKLHATCSATTSSISDLQKGELELQLNISAHLNTLGMLLSLT
jgi:hypothetical protein